MTTDMNHDVENQLCDVWLQLSAEQRAILKFVRLGREDNMLTYALIAANMTVPRLPGDDKSDIISDRCIAKYAHLLKAPDWNSYAVPASVAESS